jgi:hypothetical protein
MIETLYIPANDRESLYVFALDLPPPEAEAFVEGGGDDWPLKVTLGADTLKASHVEAFPARDLTGVGLADYLIDGLGVDDTHVAASRAALDAENQHIVILHSAAFGGIAQSLTPRTPLRHLGTFRQVPTEQRLVPLPTTSAAATPPTSAPPSTPRPAMPGGRGMLGLLAAAALVLIVGYYLSGAGQ